MLNSSTCKNTTDAYLSCGNSVNDPNGVGLLKCAHESYNLTSIPPKMAILILIYIRSDELQTNKQGP